MLILFRAFRYARRHTLMLRRCRALARCCRHACRVCDARRADIFTVAAMLPPCADFVALIRGAYARERYSALLMP